MVLILNINNQIKKWVIPAYYWKKIPTQLIIFNNKNKNKNTNKTNNKINNNFNNQ